jgi:serine/threonine protein kinase
MGFYGYEHRTNDVYMFMEYCPNGTLTSVVKNGLTELQVLKYFRQMVEGMCYMNAKGNNKKI